MKNRPSFHMIPKTKRNYIYERKERNRMRYINADQLMEIIKTHHYMLANATNSRDYGMFTIGIEQAISETESVEVVRCGDCIYRNKHGECENNCGYYIDPEFFCADGDDGKGKK